MSHITQVILSPVSGQLYDLQIHALPPKKYTSEECTELFQKCVQVDEVPPAALAKADPTDAFVALLGGSEEVGILHFWRELDDSLKGQCLAVLNRKGVEHLKTLIEGENPRTRVTECFIEDLKAALGDLDAEVARCSKHEIAKDTNAVRAQLLPQAMSKVLVTSNGFFNTAIIDTVKEIFFLKGELANQTLISEVLNGLVASNERFDSIKAPQSQDVASWAAIRSFGDVTDTQAKVAALSCCLAPVVKSTVDNDLALQFATTLRKTNLKHFVEVVRTVIETGTLSRYVDGFQRQVAFTLTSKSSPLMATIQTTRNGSIEDRWFSGVGATKNARLWEVPGIINAAKAMGIEDVKGATEKALQALIPEEAAKALVKTPRHSVTAYDVISKMGDNAALGAAAFTATYENPLMRGILNVLTDMATIRGRSHQVARVFHAVQDELHQRVQPKTLEERAQLRTLFRDFLARFGNSLKSGVVATEKMAVEALGAEERLQNVAEYFKSLAFKDVCKTDVVMNPADLVRVYQGSTSCYFTPKSAVGLFGLLREEVDRLPKDAVSYLTTDKMVLEFVHTDNVFTESQARPLWDDYQTEADAQMNTIVQAPDVQQDVYSWIKANLIAADQAELFDDAVLTLNRLPTFADFHAKMHETLDMLISDEIVRAQALEELDSYLVTKLYAAKPHLFALFAKATTKVEGQDVSLVFYPDTLLSQPAVGMLVNGTIRRLDQQEWLNTAWEFGHAAKAVAE